MRTTIDIEGPVLRDLRALQKREGGSLGSLVSRLLVQALQQHRAPSAPVAFEWSAQPMRALVDLADKDLVYAVLDDGASKAAEG